ncbi:hypothetical protein BSPA14S_H0007 (plasmid) [Borreliella spielmanii A14S]|uniref:Uncharacterized protein n=1 Tax=Borreliella spielmanii A14S TaxID=498742 RepID=C0RCD3_9SPIR|nr:hypothetical protein BSPA14S_H0007 [Borreliella spielmanii A14S]
MLQLLQVHLVSLNFRVVFLMRHLLHSLLDGKYLLTLYK